MCSSYTEYIFQAMNLEVASNHFWVWQSHKVPRHCLAEISTYALQQSVSSSTPLFRFALQDSLSVYFSAPVCWRTTLSAPPGLPGDPGEVCINLCSSLLQIQPLKLQGNSKSSINEEPGGQQQVIVFIPENIIKGSRREKKHILLSCFHYLQSSHSLLQLVACQYKGIFPFLEGTLFNHSPVCCVVG